MNSTIISTSATVAYVSLVLVKKSIIFFLGCYNVITPFVAYGSSSVIFVRVTSILVNF